MTLPDPTSLTIEERELAQRLARLGPHGEPSPALDTRILAAAHAASAPERLPQRWSMMLGLAASMVLAVGLAWRLRPLPETRPAYRSEAASAVRIISPVAASAAVESAAADSTLAAPANASVMDSDSRATPQASKPEEEAPGRARQPASASSVSQEPTVVFDEPVAPAAAASTKASDLPAPMAAAPSAPPAAGERRAFGNAAPTSATQAANDASAGSGVQPATATEARQTGMATDTTGAPTSRGDEPLDEIPPATADAPAVRDAWLRRIRDLVDSGDVAGARDSLHEFVRRYPAYPLPEDLRALQR